MENMKDGILIVDDNRSILRALEILLMPEFKNVTSVTNPGMITSELGSRKYSLVLLDMNFTAGVNNGNEGIYWLGKIKELKPDISVVMITAYGDVETAVRALKAGAVDFVMKPWDNEKLLATVRLAIHLTNSKKEIKILKTKEHTLKKEMNNSPFEIIGSSPVFMKLMTMVRKVASTDASILITGENGTGKELVAREIHRLSPRSDELLINIDMGAVPESLFESELFGHIKGAFTDAKENRPGKFEVADKGTLFLDEIGNLPLHLQSKLLAVLENRQITRIGSNEPIPIDIRLICATNKNPARMTAEGLFREDLLYRINTIHLEVPPLRERGHDIAEIADYFIRKFGKKYNKPDLKITQASVVKLMNYPWPGNIRELQNTIEKAVILTEESVIRSEDLYLNPAGQFRNINPLGTLIEMEDKMISLAIERNNGNLTAAAAQLGITRQTLHNRLKKQGQ